MILLFKSKVCQWNPFIYYLDCDWQWNCVEMYSVITIVRLIPKQSELISTVYFHVFHFTYISLTVHKYAVFTLQWERSINLKFTLVVHRTLSSLNTHTEIVPKRTRRNPIPISNVWFNKHLKSKWLILLYFQYLFSFIPSPSLQHMYSVSIYDFAQSALVAHSLFTWISLWWKGKR